MHFALFLLQSSPDPEQAQKMVMAILAIVPILILVGLVIIVLPFWFIMIDRLGCLGSWTRSFKPHLRDRLPLRALNASKTISGLNAATALQACGASAYSLFTGSREHLSLRRPWLASAGINRPDLSDDRADQGPNQQ